MNQLVFKHETLSQTSQKENPHVEFALACLNRRYSNVFNRNAKLKGVFIHVSVYFKAELKMKDIKASNIYLTSKL